jgi:hypothetical protein
MLSYLVGYSATVYRKNNARQALAERIRGKSGLCCYARGAVGIQASDVIPDVRNGLGPCRAMTPCSMLERNRGLASRDPLTPSNKRTDEAEHALRPGP